MKWLKGIILGVILLAVGAVALGLFYFLPQHDVVMVTGVEVKRMDHNGVISAENPADGPTRDVYFINTEDPVTKEVMVYRNEDTGRGWPPYFKFDTSNLQTQASDLRSTNGSTVAVPGSAPRRLHGGDAAVLPADAVVDLGEGNVLRIRSRA